MIVATLVLDRSPGKKARDRAFSQVSSAGLALLVVFLLTVGFGAARGEKAIALYLPDTTLADATYYLSAHDIQPLSIHERVYVGPFASVPDALLFSKRLESLGERSVHILRNFSASVDTIPVNVSGEFPAVLEDAAFSADALQELERLRQIDRNGARTEYISELSEIRQQHSVDEPLRGYIELNLGMEALLNGDFEAALLRLGPLAKGQVASSRSHSLMARWRIAWIHHQKGDRLRAYEIYSTMLRDHGDLPWVNARCGMELAGLLLEFSKDEKYGHFDLARREIEKMIDVIPPSFSEQLSTAELIRGESYFFEGDYAACIQNLSAFCERYRGIEHKQVAMALMFLAVAADNLGDYERGRDALLEVMQTPLPAGEHWQTIPNMNAHAATWLERVASSRGDENSAREARTFLAALEASE